MQRLGGIAVIGLSAFVLAACTKSDATPAPDSAAATAAAPAAAAMSKDSLAKMIHQGNQEWVRMVQSKNDSIAMFYSDNAVLQYEGSPPAHGMDAVRKGFADFFKANPRDFKLDEGPINSSDDGSIVYQTGTYTANVDGPGGKPMKVSGDFITLFKRTGGTYKVEFDMTNNNGAK